MSDESKSESIEVTITDPDRKIRTVKLPAKQCWEGDAQDTLHRGYLYTIAIAIGHKEHLYMWVRNPEGFIPASGLKEYLDFSELDEKWKQDAWPPYCSWQGCELHGPSQLGTWSLVDQLLYHRLVEVGRREVAVDAVDHRQR
jgi:hypothetical protein